MVVFGATQVAIALARLAREVGYEVVVADARSAFATPDRFPDVDRLVLGWPDEVFGQVGLGPDDAVVVLTHDPKLDEPAILAALRARCRYVGAIGSRQTQAGRRERLVAAGVSGEELALVRAPIGLDLGGRGPVEIALAVVAEIVAVRNGGSGRPMLEVRREGTEASTPRP
jgi:xanthine dehydrogenase accessory factor